MMTTTFDGEHTPNRDRALQKHKRFFAELEEEAGNPIACVVAEARGESSGRLHYHSLISGVKHLSRKQWWRKARERFGNTRIEPFDDTLGGACYTAKNGLSEDGEWFLMGSVFDREPGKLMSEELGTQRTRTRQRHSTKERKAIKADPPVQRVRPASTESILVYTDGAGCRPDGSGSGYCYLIEDTGKSSVKWVDGLTNNQAEWRGLRYALYNVPLRSTVYVRSDSELMVNQFNRTYAIRDPSLRELDRQVRKVIRKRRLKVTLGWVGRALNLAGKLLERR
jgi:ribonuclease HI